MPLFSVWCLSILASNCLFHTNSVLNFRLEAATSRLEDVTIFQENAVKAQEETAGTSGSKVESKAKAEDDVIKAPKAKEQLEKSKAIQAYEDFIEEYVVPFVDISKKLDPVIEKQAQLFKKAIDEEKTFLWAASLSKKVSSTDPVFAEILKPINDIISQVVQVKDSTRDPKISNNLSTVAEGVPVLGWICVETPVSYIPDFKDSAQFWGNRIMKEFRGKNEDQVSWVKAFLGIFDALKAFVKEYETTGPSWKVDGGDIKQNLQKLSPEKVSQDAPKPDAGAAAPPPPPPPPPASVFVTGDSDDKTQKSNDTTKTGMNAVFSELNQGEDITKNLRKVEKSQMTHKNPALRASGNIQVHKPVPPKKPRNLSQRQTRTSKPPRKELVDNKWMVQNVVETAGGQPLTLEVTMDQSVFISDCEAIVVQIKGKVNAVTINSCKKVGVILDSGISAVDIIKSEHIEVQIEKHIPTISADQTDTLTIYLSKSSLDTEIYTSSTTSLNIEIEQGDDMKELAAPEQFKHTIDVKNGKLISVPVEHSS